MVARQRPYLMFQMIQKRRIESRYTIRRGEILFVRKPRLYHVSELCKRSRRLRLLWLR